MKSFYSILIFTLLLFIPLSSIAKEYELYVVNTNVLNERAEPRKNAPVVGRFYRGENVVVKETKGNWAKVSSNSDGWVYKNYLEYVGQCPLVEETQATQDTEKPNDFQAIFDATSKSLHKYSDYFLLLMIAFTVGSVIVLAYDERHEYSWVGVITYIAATVFTLLYVMSDQNKDLTGFFKLIFVCACAVAILACQIVCFNELTERLLKRTSLRYSTHSVNYLKTLVCLVAALISAACGWFHWEYQPIMYIGGILVVGICIYVATDRFEFDYIGRAIPAALFCLYGCCATYVIGTLVCLVTLPLAVLCVIGYALGMSGGGDGASVHSNSGGGGGDSDSYSGPDIHYGKLGHYIDSRHFREDTGQDWYRQPDGTWRRY